MWLAKRGGSWPGFNSTHICSQKLTTRKPQIPTLNLPFLGCTQIGLASWHCMLGRNYFGGGEMDFLCQKHSNPRSSANVYNYQGNIAGKGRSRENIYGKAYRRCFRCKELPNLVNKAYSFSNISTERPVILILLPAEKVTAEQACTKLQHNETRSWAEFTNGIKSSGHRNCRKQSWVSGSVPPLRAAHQNLAALVIVLKARLRYGWSQKYPEKTNL